MPISDEQSFARLVRENKDTIYTVCYMFSKDQDEVEDLFQECLIRLWSGYPTFEGRSNVRTWIYRLCLNTCISQDRKQKKQPEKARIDLGANLFEGDDPESRQIRMLNRRISRLGVFDRAIVLLWLENMSYEEIGEIVGITAKNVSVRLFRIKEQLKKMNDE